jgi:hypothetical protein
MTRGTVLRGASVVCIILMFYPLLFMVASVLYSIRGLVVPDTAAPGIFSGLVRLGFVTCFFLANQKFLKNSARFKNLVTLSFAASLGLFYSLGFQGDPAYGKTGGIVLGVCCSVCLFIRLLAEREIALCANR